jgi:major membrane immunogen (membrane-anchored lipoprotein)
MEERIMKSILFKFFTVIVVLGLLVGCSNDDKPNNSKQTNATQNQENNQVSDSSESQEEVSVTIILSKDKEAEVLDEKEVVIQDGDNLLKVMKDNFDVVEDGGFITSIEGLAYDEANKMTWMFSVNSEPSMVGAGDVELKDGDTVNFDYQSWE